MKLMVEGWREDFNDPESAGRRDRLLRRGQPAERGQFRSRCPTAEPPSSAKRSGSAWPTSGTPKNTAFLPAYDVQVPGLHPGKKREHGLRAARWALTEIYGIGDALGDRLAGLGGAAGR